MTPEEICDAKLGLTEKIATFAICEGVIVIITSLFAIFGVWGFFAASALICLLVPLWLIAVAQWLSYMHEMEVTE